MTRKLDYYRCYRCGCKRVPRYFVSAPTEPAPVCWLHKILFSSADFFYHLVSVNR